MASCFDGKPLEPVEQSRELGNTPLRSPIPTVPATNLPATRNGLPVRIRGGAIMQEIGGSPDARFSVENTGNAIQIRVPSDTPAKPLIEVTTREQAFVPRQSGLGYIRIKGITFQHAGNGYPPPQHGLVSMKGGHHWIIENNTIEWANGVGLDIGNGGGGGGGFFGPPVGFDIIRGNTIRYCGVEGVAGMGTQGVLIEDNLIEWCGWADAERAWEAAAAKFHGARSLIFRHNLVRHIRHANGLWLDSGNTNCRVTGNVFADILTVSAAVHLEMNRGTNQIDNNIIWDIRNAEPGTPGQRGCAGSGIFIHATDRVIIAQNLIGRCDNAGVFPISRPERANSGAAEDLMIHNNIFTSCGQAAIVFINTNCESDGNLFASLSGAYLALFQPELQNWLDLPAWRRNYGWDKQGASASLQVDFDPDNLKLTMTNSLPSEKPAICNGIDTDIFGEPTGNSRLPGPFANPAQAVLRHLDPRANHHQPVTPAAE